MSGCTNNLLYLRAGISFKKPQKNPPLCTWLLDVIILNNSCKIRVMINVYLSVYLNKRECWLIVLCICLCICLLMVMLMIIYMMYIIQ